MEQGIPSREELENLKEGNVTDELVDEISALQDLVEKKQQQLEAYKANAEKAYKELAEVSRRNEAIVAKVTKALEAISNSADSHKNLITLILKGEL